MLNKSSIYRSRNSKNVNLNIKSQIYHTTKEKANHERVKYIYNLGQPSKSKDRHRLELHIWGLKHLDQRADSTSLNNMHLQEMKVADKYKKQE